MADPAIFTAAATYLTSDDPDYRGFQLFGVAMGGDDRVVFALPEGGVDIAASFTIIGMLEASRHLGRIGVVDLPGGTKFIRTADEIIYEGTTLDDSGVFQTWSAALDHLARFGVRHAVESG